MKGYSVYNAIQQLKERGFKKASVARQLNLNRRTVIRYWDMPVEAYEQKHLGLCREKALDAYRNQIIGWLKTYPTLTAAQVCDWLKEHYQEQFSERIVLYYICFLPFFNCTNRSFAYFIRETHISRRHG